MKSKYTFTKEYNFWENDHYKNFDSICSYFDKDYDPCKNEKNSQPNLVFLEIGVFEARTSVFLLDSILNIELPNRPRGILHCIDPDITENGRTNLFHHDNYVLYNSTSFVTLVDLIQKDTTKFDFIYVDGEHNACGLLEDLVLSWKLLKVGGIMLIDDYEMETLDPWFFISHKEFQSTPRLRFTHPRIAIDAFRSIYRGQYETVIDNYQIGLQKVLNFPQK